MTEMETVAKELAELFGVLGNPHRVRILEALRDGEVDVNGIQQAVGISHSGVSQHLALLRAHRLVSERRDGRHVYYHLAQPALAEWIRSGLDFIGRDPRQGEELRSAVRHARATWNRTDDQV